MERSSIVLKAAMPGCVDGQEAVLRKDRARSKDPGGDKHFQLQLSAELVGSAEPTVWRPI